MTIALTDLLLGYAVVFIAGFVAGFAFVATMAYRGKL